MHLIFPELNPIVIYYKESHNPATYTVLNFQVTDIEDSIDKLSAKGVVFQQYTEPIQTNSKGASIDQEGARLAWFKDPEGNIIALAENNQ